MCLFTCILSVLFFFKLYISGCILAKFAVFALDVMGVLKVFLFLLVICVRQRTFASPHGISNL